MASVAGKLEIAYVLTEEGISIFPSEKDAMAILKKIKSAGKLPDETDEKKEERDRLATDYYDKIIAARDLAAKDGSLKVLSFSYKPYTRSQKLEAKRLATTGDGDSSKLDQDLFEAHLISLSTDLSFDEVVDLPESIYQLLANRVFEGQSIPVERLDFFG